jgi:hypothetical protein
MYPRICCLTLALVFVSQGSAADPKTSLSNLSLEVAALQTLHRFQATPQQMEAMRKLAGDTMSKDARQAGKGSAKLRQTLTDLRDALVRDEQEKIDSLEEKLDEVLDADDTDVEDEVEITAGARRRVNEVLSIMSPRQIQAFLNDPGEELPDPLERLLTAMRVAGKLKESDWKLLCDDIVQDLSWQLGGIDIERNKWVGKRVEGFLGNLRSLKESERKKQQAELEKSAREFVANVPPTQIIHNFAQHSLAELLSNPRLTAALDARMKK